MMGFVILLGGGISLCLIWFVALMRYIVRHPLSVDAVQGTLVMMGCVFPFIVIAALIGFVYMTLEIKKNQLIVKDWLIKLQENLRYPDAVVHEKIAAQIEQEMEHPSVPPSDGVSPMKASKVLEISKNAPMQAYENLQIDEDVEVHFKES